MHANPVCAMRPLKKDTGSLIPFIEKRSER